jgi:dimethylglycine oxidase
VPTVGSTDPVTRRQVRRPHAVNDAAQVVIVGAGIVGTALAEHLAALGCSDVMVLERSASADTGGSTSHAPGLVFSINDSRTMTRFATASIERYRRGESSEGTASEGPPFSPVGSLEVAWTPERWQDLHRKHGVAMSWGIESALLDPQEARRMLPLLSDRILGALYVPQDGAARPVLCTAGMASAAQARGVRFLWDHPVSAIDVAGGRVRAVWVGEQRIAAETVVIATGIWAPLTGRLAGVPMPLVPMQHQYAVTEPVPALATETQAIRHPILRHQDKAMYFRQVGQRYGVGSYRHEPRAIDPATLERSLGPGETPAILPFTPADFRPSRHEADLLLPALRGLRLERAINGVFSFTPDGMPLLGPVPGVEGLWSAAAVWITHAVGAARSVAEWIVGGEPEWDLHECDIRRFSGHALSPRYVAARAQQRYREVYDIVHPTQQALDLRGLRLSPFAESQRALGARLVETAGWERPLWYEANQHLLDEAPATWPERSGWAATGWSSLIGAEHRAVRDAVGLFDLTPFHKLEIRGPGACSFLQRLAANDIDTAVGRTTYTALLDERAGFQADLTVSRLAGDRFMVVTGAAYGVLDEAWLRDHLPTDGTVELHDLTSTLCCIGVWGPRARELVDRFDAAGFTPQASPYRSILPRWIGEVPVLASRISYVGELGWELYAPTEYGARLWSLLFEAGRPLRAIAAGIGAMDSLRLEKGHRLWGVDIDPEHDPYSAGLGFAVRLGKGDFLGRAALLRIRDRGPSSLLRCLVLDDPAAVVLGKEPVLRDGRVVGSVTSANMGYTINKSIAYSYLPIADAIAGTRLTVEYFGASLPATVTDDPSFDPEHRRMRG